VIAFMLGGQADMLAVELLGKDVADQVPLVAALHDHNVHARLRVIQPSLENFVPGAQDRVPRYLAVNGLHVMGIIDHNDVGPEPGETRERCGAPVTAGQIAEQLNLVASWHCSPQRA
jgi:hypothetical protein